MTTHIDHTLANVLAEEIRCYPSLFKRGGDVLSYILLTPGNGYDWLDGEPLDRNRNPDKIHVYDTFNSWLKYSKPAFQNHEPRGEQLLGLLKEYQEDKLVIEAADKLALDKRVTMRYIPDYDATALFYTVQYVGLKPGWLLAINIVRGMLAWYPTASEREQWKSREWMLRQGLDL
jgi:hypothetical protein